MINLVEKPILQSLLYDNVPYNMSYAYQMFLENGFEMFGGDHCENGTYCTMWHNKSSIKIKLSKKKFFGCSVTVLEDPNNILDNRDLME